MAPIPLSPKQAALVAEAKKWVGTKGTDPAVAMFQKAIGGYAAGQAWCCDFAEYCVLQVDQALGGTPTWLVKTQGVLDLWNRTTLAARVQALEVVPGDLVVWQHWVNGAPTTEGHVGIVVDVPGPGEFQTIEGNTTPSQGIDRTGDGVYLKMRTSTGSSTMKVKGFLRAWNLNG